MIDFYDRTGAAIAYSQDGEHIYLFSGRPVAYLSGTAVYSFGGQHIGWFQDGWLRDKRGGCALFTAEAKGGPVRPVRHVKPVKGVRHVRPVKGVKAVKSVKPVRQLSWSPLSGARFFG